MQRQKGKSIKSHDCYKNWAESSKSMECDGISNICMNAPSKKYCVHHLITDDDTTMRYQLKKREISTKVNYQSNKT